MRNENSWQSKYLPYPRNDTYAEQQMHTFRALKYFYLVEMSTKLQIIQNLLMHELVLSKLIKT